MGQPKYKPINPKFTAQFKRRIKDELSYFMDVWSPEQLARMETKVFKSHMFFMAKEDKNYFEDDNKIFGYNYKVNQVVQHFAKAGLTREDYLNVCSKYPVLLFRSPRETIQNIEDVVNYFSKDGLTTKDYITKACLKNHFLFGRSGKNICQNIQGVVDHFSQYGLSNEHYMKAWLKYPALATTRPDTIIANVTAVPQYFAADGLTEKDYMQKACFKSPELYYLSAKNIISNAKGMTNHFAKDGLTRPDYLLKACLKEPNLLQLSYKTMIPKVENILHYFSSHGLSRQSYITDICIKQPQLFYSTPRTIARHVFYMQTMVDLGLLPQGEPGQKYVPLFDNLKKSPKTFCLGDDNFLLRLDYGTRHKKNKGKFGLLAAKRNILEKEYADRFGPFDANVIDTGLRKELERRDLYPLSDKNLKIDL